MGLGNGNYYISMVKDDKSNYGGLAAEPDSQTGGCLTNVVDGRMRASPPPLLFAGQTLLPKDPAHSRPGSELSRSQAIEDMMPVVDPLQCLVKTDKMNLYLKRTGATSPYGALVLVVLPGPCRSYCWSTRFLNALQETRKA